MYEKREMIRGIRFRTYSPQGTQYVVSRSSIARTPTVG